MFNEWFVLRVGDVIQRKISTCSTGDGYYLALFLFKIVHIWYIWSKTDLKSHRATNTHEINGWVCAVYPAYVSDEQRWYVRSVARRCTSCCVRCAECMCGASAGAAARRAGVSAGRGARGVQGAGGARGARARGAAPRRRARRARRTRATCAAATRRPASCRAPRLHRAPLESPLLKIQNHVFNSCLLQYIDGSSVLHLECFFSEIQMTLQYKSHRRYKSCRIQNTDGGIIRRWELSDGVTNNESSVLQLCNWIHLNIINK